MLVLGLGEKIKGLRKKKGWSQADLAGRVEVHDTHISRLETGRYTPSLDLLKRLAEVFEVSTDYLLFESAADPGEVTVGDKSLYEKMRLLEQLAEDDRRVIDGVIEAFLTKQKVWQALGREGVA